MIHSFDYRQVSSLKAAFDAASERRGFSLFMAGGTDLLVQIKEGKANPQCVIDLKGIREMEGVAFKDDSCLVGALTRIRTLETSAPLLKKLPLLVEAARQLGSVQVRQRATVGGNLCNASPSADMAPGLLALDAEAIVCGEKGTRTIALSDFFRGPGTTALTEGEVMTGLRVPLIRMTPSRRGSVYYKLSTRKAMDLAFVSVAVSLDLGEDDRIVGARIALGAVAPTPMRAYQAESALHGRVLSREVARESAEMASQSSSPISDHRATAGYRREMVRELCEKGVLTAFERAKTDTETGSLDRTI